MIQAPGSCGVCKHWQQSYGGEGRCHRVQPDAVNACDAYWPTTTADDYCGQQVPVTEYVATARFDQYTEHMDWAKEQRQKDQEWERERRAAWDLHSRWWKFWMWGSRP